MGGLKLTKIPFLKFTQIKIGGTRTLYILKIQTRLQYQRLRDLILQFL
jgi:hypothetical protein